MNRAQWTLVALSFAGDGGLSPVQLQKSLFLLGRELPGKVGDFYEFVPYNYGPFCSDIYADAIRLRTDGLASISNIPGLGYQKYAVTEAGDLAACECLTTANQDAVKYLKEVVAWAKRSSFSTIVRSIYAKYPEYRENSVFLVK